MLQHLVRSWKPQQQLNPQLGHLPAPDGLTVMGVIPAAAGWVSVASRSSNRKHLGTWRVVEILVSGRFLGPSSFVDHGSCMH